jgi:hypothetical protein
MSKWETNKCDVPQGSILGPLMFLIYINDLPKIINKEYSMVLYADDASLLITDPNKKDFEANLNRTFGKLNNWFHANLLTLDFQKRQYLEFRVRNNCRSPIVITSDQKKNGYCYSN